MVFGLPVHRASIVVSGILCTLSFFLHISGWVCFFFNFLSCLFIFERETEHEVGRGRELSAQSLRRGSISRTVRS